MKVFKYSRVLVLIIAAGLIAALVVSFQRNTVEQANRTVDLALDYEDVLKLAQQSGKDPSVVLQDVKEAGISSLAVYETTFKKLNENGKATAVPGADLIKAYHSGALEDPAWRALVADGTVKGTEVYVTGHDPLTYREVKEDLLRRLGSDRVTPLSVGGEEVLAVKAEYESFLKMNLGMPTDEMKAVNDAGFYVLARPSNYEACTPDDVRAVFSRLEGVKVSEMVFSGKECLGSTKALQTTIDELKDRHMTLGLIEAVSQLQFYPQTGRNEIAKGIGYDHIARLYSIPKDEQPKLKIDTAVERWGNTDMERNIRIDLLRIYDKPSPELSLYDTNMAYFHAVSRELAKRGYEVGPAASFSSFYPSRYLRAVMMFGVAAAGVLYLSLILPRLNARPRLQYMLVLVLGLAAAIPLLMGNGSKIRVIAALASANLFPALAVIWQLDRIRALKECTLKAGRLIVTAFLALLITGVLSYVGAAYLSGSLADTEYLLEFNIFRGIKLTFILPIVLVAIAFLQRFDVFDGRMDDTEGVMEQLRRILDMPVRIKTLLGLLVVAAAGVVFIARSGHTAGMPVPQAELKLRAFLEQAFYARPRSKELFIGHPAFMLAAMAFLKKWPTWVFFVLVLVATIGQGSMVETFAHMRTPVFMSTMRGIGGIVLGGALGAVLMVLIEVWQRILNAAKRKTEAHS